MWLPVYGITRRDGLDNRIIWHREKQLKNCSFKCLQRMLFPFRSADTTVKSRWWHILFRNSAMSTIFASYASPPGEGATACPIRLPRGPVWVPCCWPFVSPGRFGLWACTSSSQKLRETRTHVYIYIYIYLYMCLSADLGGSGEAGSEEHGAGRGRAGRGGKQRSAKRRPRTARGCAGRAGQGRPAGPGMAAAGQRRGGAKGEGGRARGLAPGGPRGAGTAGGRSWLRNEACKSGGWRRERAPQAEGQRERWGKPRRAVVHCF